MSGRVLCEGVSKRFRRGVRHDSLRDLIPGLARRSTHADEFWALDNLSFDVRAGTALGIIGANGAGKSTALKILTRVLEPTTGRYTVTGRVGALIELAAGFHPDLTGRENVFLQGAILGLSRAWLKQRFDDIVGFAGVEAFIDTPIKRYSSGMNARLGFSIAAHIEPDVLIVDEILSVGDLSFQQRAFQRLKDLTTSGIAVILVSHQLERLGTLCTEGLLLERGKTVAYGPCQEVIATYVERSGQNAASFAKDGAEVHIDRLELLDGGEVVSGGRFRVAIEGSASAEALATIDPAMIRVVSASTGEFRFGVTTTELGLTLPPGRFRVEFDLEANLPAGLYLLESVAVDRTRFAYRLRGPTAHLRVEAGIPFRGNVQLNARARLDPAGPGR
ncbi:MAG: polysaccharide ABC transporter ATP-binding protein [Gemmatimonadales bacterium]